MFKIHKKKRIILSAFVVAVLILPAVTFAINRVFMSEKTFALTYNIPAGYTTFVDPNFYDCVVNTFVRDYMNYDIDSLEEIQANGLTDEQLDRIDQLVCVGDENKGRIADVTGLEKMTRMYYLDLNSNNITSIDLSGVTTLNYLDLHSNNLTSVNIDGDTTLRSLFLGYNQLTSVNLSTNTNLRTLDLSSNHLPSLDISNNTGLVTLYASYNQLPSLDVSSNTALRLLNIDHNQMTSINLSSNTSLVDLISDDIVIYGGITPSVSGDTYTFNLSGLGFLADGYHEGYTVEFSIDDTSYYSYDKDSMTLTVSDFENAGSYIQINGVDNKDEGGFSYKFGLPSELSFDVNGGEGSFDTVLCYPESGSDNCVVTLPAGSPSKANYQFLGWATSASANTAAYQPNDSYEFNGSQTLYAIWAPIRTLSYNSNGGNITPAAQTCYANDTMSDCSVTISTAEITKDGYELKGWADSAGASVATYQSGGTISLSSNKMIYAVWGLESTEVSLSFDVNGGGGSVATQTCEIDVEHTSCSVTIPDTDPTNGDYYFLGWANSADAKTAVYQSGSSISISADRMLYAIWAPVYNLGYDANGDDENPSSGSCHADPIDGPCSVVVTSTIPERNGYNFLGWSETATAGIVDYSAGESVSLSDDKTLHAVWELIITNVSLGFDLGGGEGAVATQTCTVDINNPTCTVTIPDVTPERNGYNFLGWAESSSASTPDYNKNDNVTISSNKVLHAVWELISTRVSLGFDANGGEGSVATQNCTIDVNNPTCNVTIPNTIPERNGYNFLGWAESSTASVADYGAGGSVTLNGDKTLYAVWELITTNVALSFDLRGGEGAVATQTCTVDINNPTCSVTIPDVTPEKNGYNFLGWTESSTGTTPDYNKNASVTLSSNKILYAVWELITNNISLSFDLNGGEGEVAAQNCVVSVEQPTCTLTIPATIPEKEGYRFLGWGTSTTSADYQPSGEVSLSANRTFYAVWELITTTVRLNFDLNGADGTMAAQTCITDAFHPTCDVTIPNATLERTGYNFLGWADTAEATEAAYHAGNNITLSVNKTVYAVWELKPEPEPEPEPEPTPDSGDAEEESDSSDSDTFVPDTGANTLNKEGSIAIAFTMIPAAIITAAVLVRKYLNRR